MLRLESNGSKGQRTTIKSTEVRVGSMTTLGIMLGVGILLWCIVAGMML